MLGNLRLSRMVAELEQVCRRFTDQRTGKNSRYEMRDAAMSAFSVFFTQSPSFLAHQRDMKLRKGRSNAEGLFGLSKIPGDNQIRNLLDGVNPQVLSKVYRYIFVELERSKIFEGYRSFARQLLVAMDGTQL